MSSLNASLLEPSLISLAKDKFHFLIKVPEYLADPSLKGHSTFYFELKLFAHLLISFLHYKPPRDNTLSVLYLSPLTAHWNFMPHVSFIDLRCFSSNISPAQEKLKVGLSTYGIWSTTSIYTQIKWLKSIMVIWNLVVHIAKLLTIIPRKKQNTVLWGMVWE